MCTLLLWFGLSSLEGETSVALNLPLGYHFIKKTIFYKKLDSSLFSQVHSSFHGHSTLQIDKLLAFISSKTLSARSSHNTQRQLSKTLGLERNCWSTYGATLCRAYFALLPPSPDYAALFLSCLLCRIHNQSVCWVGALALLAESAMKNHCPQPLPSSVGRHAGVLGKGFWVCLFVCLL